jgi:hypothetical protein
VPYKLFIPGEVLTASDLQQYSVDQSIFTFDSSADRTTNLAAPSQGMMSFLNDSGTTWYYAELYNASTNPGGASVAGWYPVPGSAVFMGTCGSFTTTNGVQADAGATGNLYTENIDPLGWHSAATNTQRIIPTVAGLYRISSDAVFASNSSGTRNVNIFKNTARSYSRSVAAIGGGSVTPTGGSFVTSMNGTTDYIIAAFNQDSGGNLAMTSVVTVVEFLKPLSV